MNFTLGASSHESHVLLRRNLIVLLCILAPESCVCDLSSRAAARLSRINIQSCFLTQERDKHDLR
jgi:hypothetical protein